MELMEPRDQLGLTGPQGPQSNDGLDGQDGADGAQDQWINCPQGPPRQ